MAEHERLAGATSLVVKLGSVYFGECHCALAARADRFPRGS
jgi:hypothetical protein